MHKTIKIFDQDIVYRELGSGSPMLLLHGYGGSPLHWEIVAKELSKNYLVIVPNLSPVFLHRENKYGFKEQVELVTTLIKNLHAMHGPVHVAGASYGGTLAWAAASVGDLPLRSMTLLSPMPPAPIAKIRNQLLRTMVLFARWPVLLKMFLYTPFARKALPRIEDMFIGSGSRKRAGYRLAKLDSRKMRLVIHIMHRFLWIVNQEDWKYWNRMMKKLSVDVCLIWGNWDRLFLKTVPWDIEKNLQNCRLHTVDKAGHLAMKENAPEVLSIMNTFLSSDRKAA